MGAQIAAHLANAGIPVVLMDIVPTELTNEEKAKGLELSSPEVRNRIVRTLFERMLRLSPRPLFTTETARLITLGNIDDDLPSIQKADWIIEAVLERLDLKQAVHAKIMAAIKPEAIVTTNTSGLPIQKIIGDLPLHYRRRFFVAHFFNPPRYMRLLELVPTADTDPDLMRSFATFAETLLGKRVVIAKDTPGFVANRIGCFDLQTVLWLAETEHLTVDEVDVLTGPLIGRPASATFRLCDVVGIDLIAQLGRNLQEMLPGQSEKHIFTPPPFLCEVIKRSWWGEKTGQGFYKRVQTSEGRKIYSLDLRTLEYRPQQRPGLGEVEAIANIAEVTERIRALYALEGRAANFVWKHLSAVLCYAAEHALEISDGVFAVDQAMKWGYNWELGPFEIWDAIGVSSVVSRLEADGRPIPRIVRDLLSSGRDHFYEHHKGGATYYDPIAQTDRYTDVPAKALSLSHCRTSGRLVQKGSVASLIDLDDGVACLEFHAKLNVISEETLTLLRDSLEIVRRDFVGLVIGNQGPHFSAGANLKQLAAYIEAARWADVERMLRDFQAATSTLKQYEKPVVAAIHGYALGGGCEFAMGCDYVVAAAETSMGLPEIGVGLIPGAHGTKEMLVRCTEGILRNGDPDYYSGVRLAWETIFQSRISTSAAEAAKLRYLRSGEWAMLLNRDLLIGEAKGKVLQLASGYRPSVPRTDIPAIGESGVAGLSAMLHAMRASRQISDYDQQLGAKLGYILCGGELSSLHFVSESYILELELEAILSLCGEAKTLERIRHTLKTGKPLRN